MAQQPDRRNFLERRFNLPPIGDLKGNLDGINTLVQALDKEKVKQATTLLTQIAKIQQQSKPGELERVERILQLVIQILCNPQAAKIVEDIQSTVCAVQSLVKMLPPDILKGVKLGELIEDIKKDVR